MSTTLPPFAFLDSEGILHLHDEKHAKQHWQTCTNFTN
ncbi:hypothetical protein ABH892_001672 [Paenibacillus sp. RC254]